ncbi:hypothetical protein BaRGS_00023424 [Batillaria attramentaria]|uniref:Uncharacterized protein n=1 Tax=Batillaria attramentaria TaxID=370345 RepID=A0ABD0KDZ0_9CAEN
MISTAQDYFPNKSMVLELKYTIYFPKKLQVRQVMEWTTDDILDWPGLTMFAVLRLVTVRGQPPLHQTLTTSWDGQWMVLIRWSHDQRRGGQTD